MHYDQSLGKNVEIVHFTAICRKYRDDRKYVLQQSGKYWDKEKTVDFAAVFRKHEDKREIYSNMWQL